VKSKPPPSADNRKQKYCIKHATQQDDEEKERSGWLSHIFAENLPYD